MLRCRRDCSACMRLCCICPAHTTEQSIERCQRQAVQVSDCLAVFGMNGWLLVDSQQTTVNSQQSAVSNTQTTINSPPTARQRSQIDRSIPRATEKPYLERTQCGGQAHPMPPQLRIRFRVAPAAVHPRKQLGRKIGQMRRSRGSFFHHQGRNFPHDDVGGKHGCRGG